MADITLRNVAKSYARTKVIHDLSLTINSGEFVVILGPSGCGKSTLLRMIAGLESITSGVIAIDDVMVNKLEPRERGCAMVFQNYALYPHMTVAENIGYALRVAGVAKAVRQERISKVAETLGLTEFLTRKPGQLSGGQRQRVAMGRAMIREPKVFLYDEPLSNLDARLRVAMRVEIRKLHQRLGTTSLFVTHDQVEALTLADRIVVMNKGHIEQVGTPLDIYERPASTYVAGFIGTPGLNLIDGIADPSSGTIQFADGQRLAYDRDRWRKVVAGPVTAGFRAEAVAYGRDGLQAQFEFAEEHGAARHAHLRFGDSVLIAHVAGQIRDRAGDRISLHVPAEALQLFDKVTGRRLDGEMLGQPVREVEPA